MSSQKLSRVAVPERSLADAHVTRMADAWQGFRTIPRACRPEAGDQVEEPLPWDEIAEP